MNLPGPETQATSVLWLHPGLLKFPGPPLGIEDGCWSASLYPCILASGNEEANETERATSTFMSLVRP